MKRTLSLLLLSLLLAMAGGASAHSANNGKIVVAYVTSWTTVMPDDSTMTHINYAFGHVTDSFDGVRIDNEQRLRDIVKLKQHNPELKVMLSVGGWGSGRFSEMAGDAKLRKSFARDCRRVTDEFGLDGIDIDWEYPGEGGAGISSSPDDVANFTLLMRDLRKALGDDLLLTCATAAGGAFYDFPNSLQYIDFVNIMAYDMDNPPYHHSALYPCKLTRGMTSSKALGAHLALGIPREKLVLGMPFYGRGKPRGYIKNLDTQKGELEERWDDEGQVPYLVDSNGRMVLGFDNPRSLAAKCQFVKEQGLLGAMYWEYGDDNEAGDERMTLYQCLLKNNPKAIPVREDYPGNYARAPRFKALLYYGLYEEEAHVQFAKQAEDFFRRLTWGEGWTLDVTHDFSAFSLDSLKTYSVVIMPNRAPSGKEEREVFEQYMKQGGGWIGFHGAGYNDSRTRWPWYVKFLGGGVFLCNNWPPQPVLVETDSSEHPVTRSLPHEFVVPASEWYMWKPGPRENADVEVLVSISQKMLPLGLKDVIRFGDLPIVWTNRNYRMIYLNMGHGDEEFTDATQNLLFVNALRWIARRDPHGSPFE